MVKCLSLVSMLRWRMHIRVSADPISLVAPREKRDSLVINWQRPGAKDLFLQPHWGKTEETRDGPAKPSSLGQPTQGLLEGMVQRPPQAAGWKPWWHLREPPRPAISSESRCSLAVAQRSSRHLTFKDFLFSDQFHHPGFHQPYLVNAINTPPSPLPPREKSQLEVLAAVMPQGGSRARKNEMGGSPPSLA